MAAPNFKFVLLSFGLSCCLAGCNSESDVAQSATPSDEPTAASTVEQAAVEAAPLESDAAVPPEAAEVVAAPVEQSQPENVVAISPDNGTESVAVENGTVPTEVNQSAPQVPQPGEPVPAVAAPEATAQVSTEQNLDPAISDLVKFAEAGDADAQYQLAVANDANYEESSKWYLKAAEQGNVEAQTVMAVRYALGQGVEKNPEEAARWLALAENQDQQNVTVVHSTHQVAVQPRPAFKPVNSFELPPAFPPPGLYAQNPNVVTPSAPIQNVPPPMPVQPIGKPITYSPPPQVKLFVPSAPIDAPREPRPPISAGMSMLGASRQQPRLPRP